MTAAPRHAAVATRTAYRETLLELARADRRIICLDADVGGFEDTFGAELPEQYVNVGIAEANMIGMSAGLASVGLLPFAHTISAFASARACEQIKLDVAVPAALVRIVVTHGGLSAGHYGPSHHAVEDLALMRVLPHLTVVVPADADETIRATRAVAYHPGPVLLRLGRAATGPIDAPPSGEFRIGRAVPLRDGSDVALVATGPLAIGTALDAAADLDRIGISARVLNMHTVKPIDRAVLIAAARETAGIVTLEDHLRIGGLGGAVCEVVSEEFPCPVRRIGIAEDYVARTVGTEAELLAEAGLTTRRAVAAALEVLEARRPSTAAPYPTGH